MRAAVFPRKFVVELPDDDTASLCAMAAIAGGEGTTHWLGEWLLHFSDDVTAVHARLAFGHLRVTADWRFIVPDADRNVLEAWLGLHTTPAQASWIHLEVVEPWSLRYARDWGRAHQRVLDKRPRLRSRAHWPHLFPE
jgi:hypothetical protein